MPIAENQCIYSAFACGGEHVSSLNEVKFDARYCPGIPTALFDSRHFAVAEENNPIQWFKDFDAMLFRWPRG